MTEESKDSENAEAGSDGGKGWEVETVVRRGLAPYIGR